MKNSEKFNNYQYCKNFFINFKSKVLESVNYELSFKARFGTKFENENDAF